MKTRELENMGVPRGEAMKLAIRLIVAAARDGHGKRTLRTRIAAVVADPAANGGDSLFGALADVLAAQPERPATPILGEPVPWRQWGHDIEPQSIAQMEMACRLPIAVRGALMPDAHLGYGLPIGGVLATDRAVIPYAVGVDIACRMKMTVLDLPPTAIAGQTARLERAIEEETRFGLGASFADPHEHAVLDDDWSVSPVTADLKDKARRQLGTSGSGNHFVEFGLLTVPEASGPGAPDLDLAPGVYVALLSHSGSRGVGATVAGHYAKLATRLHPELPKPLRHLAWLDLGTDEGEAYWAAMELMGRYAAANHALIHRTIARHLKAGVLASVENHHNFAWREEHDGRELVVHRKGATPAGDGVLGVIPGSMATPAYVVRGRGSAASLNSASHGAGRVMSRTQAKRSLTWSAARALLRDRRVTLMSAGLDEVPMVYKDIEAVMAAQTDLVDVIAKFEPRIVKMAPGGERAED